MSYYYYNNSLRQVIKDFFGEDEIRDISTYGCAWCAPSGITNYNEVCEFVADNLQALKDYGNDYGYDLPIIQSIASARDVGNVKDEQLEALQQEVFYVVEGVCSKIVDSRDFD